MTRIKENFNKDYDNQNTFDHVAMCNNSKHNLRFQYLSGKVMAITLSIDIAKNVKNTTAGG